MLTTLRLPALAAALTVALPAALSAQDAECAVDLAQPAQLFQANLLIQRAAGDPAGDGTPRSLRDAARQLSDDRRFTGNPMGQAFLKAQLYIVWLHRDETPALMSLADLNFGRDRNTMVDLVGAADSIFTMIEEAHPGCADETTRWRQSKPWSDRIGAAYRYFQASELDSASHYAAQARRLDRSSPYLFNVLAQIALQRGQQEAGIALLDTAIAAAATDTAMADTRRQLRMQQAAQLQEWGSGLPDQAQQKAALTRASRSFLTLAQETPAHEESPMLISVGLDIAMMLQDSALIAMGLDGLKSSAAEYADLALLIGGEVARMTGRADDAITLYGETIKKNPNARDANYFLAYLLIDGGRHEEAVPMLEKLLEIDPANGDNYILKSIVVRNRATVANERLRAERNAQARATIQREITAHNREADQLGAQEAALGLKLQVIGFERREAGAKLNGTIENRGQAAKAYTVEVSFLNLAGEAVETKSVTTESIAPNATAGFELEATAPGIVAWRYVLK
ncbi:MAG: tetratricopeptide repeat protein [Gemmatimonadaceae bacterium]|nr:tetratricopeptide repeat protein [Gemmatimonadaceae bacterium]MCW5825886.1 tetratricopeptide repeat protein [Gemmatimonadaceae bacterium]